MSAPANLLTFDIEGFIESSHDSMHIPLDCISDELEWQEIEVNTLLMLEILAEFNQKATFFILGRIARDMPALVRKIAEAGHEIASHGFYHRRLFHFPRPDVERFLADAKHALEDAGGVPVYGFRAPEFSIVRINGWVFDILRNLSFRYDSSVVPTTIHDVYGIENFPTAPFRLPNGLIEIPMSTFRIAGRNVPVGGGGYLRLFPLSVTRAAFASANREGRPGVVYIHPFEMGKVVRRVPGMDLVRRARTYTGIKTVTSKLRSLMAEFRFVRMIDYVNAMPVDALPAPALQVETHPGGSRRDARPIGR